MKRGEIGEVERDGGDDGVDYGKTIPFMIYFKIVDRSSKCSSYEKWKATTPPSTRSYRALLRTKSPPQDRRPRHRSAPSRMSPPAASTGSRISRRGSATMTRCPVGRPTQILTTKSCRGLCLRESLPPLPWTRGTTGTGIRAAERRKSRDPWGG